MALLTTKLSHSSNSVKQLSSLNSKFIYLKCERNLSYQSAPPKYTFDIYKRAPFSPWHKTQTKYTYSYCTITNDKNIKRDHFRQCLEGLNYNAYNQRLHARALSSSQVKSNNGPSKLKQFGIAIVLGMAAGGVYAILKEWKKSNSIFSENLALKQIGNETADSAGASAKSQYSLQEKPPSFKPARQIRNSADTTGLKLTLFQYQTCPFCCKARAFLDYFGFNYDVIEVNSVMRTQMKWSSYKKVPTLVIETADGEVIQLVDSSMIISSLYSFISNKKGLIDTAACYPRISSLDDNGKPKEEISNKYFLMFDEVDTGRKKEDIAQERKWRKWVDDTFVHTLSPNVYRTPSESLQAFQWFNEVGEWEKHFSAWERFVVVYIGAAAMWIIGKKLKKRHGLKPDVRQSLYDETNIWLKAIKAKKSGMFMGGEAPNLADLAVYGALSAIEGCDAFSDLNANTKVKPWFEAMKQAVQKSEGKAIFSNN